MDKKLAVYICKGCEIADAIDVDKVVEVISEEQKEIPVKAHECLCSKDGIETIRSEIKEQNANRVIIAACSQRMFPELFEFGDEIITERVNMREQVAWCHDPNDEDTQMLAEDQVRMGIAKAKVIEYPVPHTEDTSRDILVIGGGMTGMTAAKAAAEAGYNVTLVEKEAELGGWARRQARILPQKPPYRDPEPPRHQELIDAVSAHERIAVHTATTIKKTSGQPGKFVVQLKNGSEPQPITVGAIVQATGWNPYDPTKLTHLGFGQTPDIITNIEMEDMAREDRIVRPSDGAAPKSVAFIQCAGSRDADHLPYCSAVCCRVSLKQALYIREKYPNAIVYIIYKDIRTPAQHEQFYARVQDDDGVFMTKGEIASVTAANGKVDIDVEQTLLGENIRIQADMVVLATGMVPSTYVEPKVAGNGDNPGEQNDNPGTNSAVAGEETQEGMTSDGKKEAMSAERGAKIINLTYRQGTDLPTLKYGFPDSHFICFPYETRRTGIYAAGTVRAPMDLASGRRDAYGAALKAIQAVEAVKQGAAVHPRSGDLSFPDFMMQKCTQCKRCTEECPFGTLDEDEKGTPLPNPFRCRRCGVCLGACPERIISFKNYSISMVSAMIKSVHVPDEFEEKPRILCFVCENDAMPTIDMVGTRRMRYNSNIRIIPLRCLGSMNAVWVSDALARGFDGVILLGCKKGDDYQCHFIRGSELAGYRMENVREKLTQLVLEEDRVEIHELAINEFERVPKIFNDFLEVIETVGPNPYKGM